MTLPLSLSLTYPTSQFLTVSINYPPLSPSTSSKYSAPTTSLSHNFCLSMSSTVRFITISEPPPSSPAFHLRLSPPAAPSSRWASLLSPRSYINLLCFYLSLLSSGLFLSTAIQEHAVELCWNNSWAKERQGIYRRLHWLTADYAERRGGDCKHWGFCEWVEIEIYHHYITVLMDRFSLQLLH